MATPAPPAGPPRADARAPERLDSDTSARTAVAAAALAAPPAASRGARSDSPAALGAAAASPPVEPSAGALAPGPRYKRGPGLSFFPGGPPGESLCQVPGCAHALNKLRDYYKRYKICPAHLKLPEIVVEGQAIRFCQQCGRFQLTTEFDGDRRSCRRKLEQHNKRRRGEGGSRPPSAWAPGAAPWRQPAGGGAYAALPGRLVGAREAASLAQLQPPLPHTDADAAALRQLESLLQVGGAMSVFGGQPAPAHPPAAADVLAAALAALQPPPPPAAPPPPYNLLAAAAAHGLLAGAPGAAAAALALELVARLQQPAAAPANPRESPAAALALELALLPLAPLAAALAQLPALGRAAL